MEVYLGNHTFENVDKSLNFKNGFALNLSKIIDITNC